MPTKPERGRIVKVRLLDPQGQNPKIRPVVIVDDSAAPLIGVAISSTFDQADRNCVKLPWHPQGRVLTRLKKESAALCQWLVKFDEADIVDYGGLVPPDHFKDILAKLSNAG